MQLNFSDIDGTSYLCRSRIFNVESVEGNARTTSSSSWQSSSPAIRQVSHKCRSSQAFTSSSQAFTRSGSVGTSSIKPSSSFSRSPSVPTTAREEFAALKRRIDCDLVAKFGPWSGGRLGGCKGTDYDILPRTLFIDLPRSLVENLGAQSPRETFCVSSSQFWKRYTRDRSMLAQKSRVSSWSSVDVCNQLAQHAVAQERLQASPQRPRDRWLNHLILAEPDRTTVTRPKALCHWRTIVTVEWFIKRDPHACSL